MAENFSLLQCHVAGGGGEDSNATKFCPLGSATMEQITDTYEPFASWMEGVVKPTVGILGLLCNFVTVPVLLSK